MISSPSKMLKPYGIEPNDGVAEVIVTLPLQTSDETKRALEKWLDRHGLEVVNILGAHLLPTGLTTFRILVRSTIEIQCSDGDKVSTPSQEEVRLEGRGRASYDEVIQRAKKNEAPSPKQESGGRKRRYKRRR